MKALQHFRAVYRMLRDTGHSRWFAPREAFLNAFWRPISCSDHGDSKLKTEISKNETRAEYAAWVIVLGLLIEVVLAIVFPHGQTFIENWAPVLSTGLIALGVYGEIRFSRKAGAAHKALQISTESKLAEALACAAKAEEDLIKYLTPRRALVRRTSIPRQVDYPNFRAQNLTSDSVTGTANKLCNQS
jgi:hypothetical protein